MVKIRAVVSQDFAKIGVRIAYRLEYEIRHVIVTADKWEEIAEYIEGDEDVIDCKTLWDLSGELD